MQGVLNQESIAFSHKVVQKNPKPSKCQTRQYHWNGEYFWKCRDDSTPIFVWICWVEAKGLGWRHEGYEIALWF